MECWRTHDCCFGCAETLLIFHAKNYWATFDEWGLISSRQHCLESSFRKPVYMFCHCWNYAVTFVHFAVCVSIIIIHRFVQCISVWCIIAEKHYTVYWTVCFCKRQVLKLSLTLVVCVSSNRKLQSLDYHCSHDENKTDKHAETSANNSCRWVGDLKCLHSVMSEVIFWQALWRRLLQPWKWK